MKKIIVALLIAGILVAIAFSYLTYEHVNENAQKHSVKRLSMYNYIFYGMITIINIFLLLALLIIYFDSYLKTKSSFMLGLVFFIGTLMIQSILSIPVIRAFFGFPYLFSLPYMFEMFALVILLVLSME
ncbi:MAG: hypothetical protein J7K61_03170 [Thermoplasmata archaeon]|nr:hypothetical protein [Thermoplasmata archaeon]